MKSVYCTIFCHLIVHHLIKKDQKKKKKENFKQKETKLVLYGIMFRVVPLGLALLYSYYPLTF